MVLATDDVPTSKPMVGVDIGGTNLRVALVSGDGKIVTSTRVLLNDRLPEQVSQQVAVLIRQLEHDVATSNLRIGVGLAAMIRNGVVANAPNLGWRNVAFAEMLSQDLGDRSVRLVNDLSAAAWGERAAGASRGCNEIFTVFVGTGVGSAIISRGELIDGAFGVAGELGHVKVIFDGGRRCGCGDDGCLEAYAGGAQLVLRMREAGISGTATQLEEQALAGNASARKIYFNAIEHLGLAIANQVTVLNPQMLILGGGVLMNCPTMVQKIESIVMSRSGVAAREHLTIKIAQLGDDSGIVGAALLGNGC